jgi:hypothetical protein
VSKTNPDLTVSGNSDALKKYLGEGLGGAAAKGVHFIVTTIDVKEVLYIYPPYLKIDSKLRDLENHQRTSTPVLVQAEEFPLYRPQLRAA